MALEEDKNPVQKKEFRIVGLSRSGNHGVINWILNQLDGDYCFLNCVEPKYNPFFTSRPLNEEGDTYQTNIDSFDLKKEQQKEFSRKDFLLYNHEDCFLGPLNNRLQKENRDKWVGTSMERKDLLILRDPFNLFASRIKAGLIRGHYTHHGAKPISLLTLKRIYKQHAREFLGEKNYLRNKLLINFNSWTEDENYRKQLTENLGIPFTDRGFREVAKVAGGSSFDGTSLSGNTQKMDLHHRWMEFAEDAEYWDLFDAELLELSRAIFGNTSGLRYAEKYDKVSS